MSRNPLLQKEAGTANPPSMEDPDPMMQSQESVIYRFNMQIAHTILFCFSEEFSFNNYYGQGIPLEWIQQNWKQQFQSHRISG